MKMRELYDRIYRRVYISTNPSVKQLIVPWIESAVCVDLQNVYGWSKGQKKFALNNYLNKCPQRLPFPQMWFEWAYLHEDGEYTHTHPFGVLAQEIARDNEPIGIINFCMFSHDPHSNRTALMAMGKMEDRKIEPLEYDCPDIMVEERMPGQENLIFITSMTVIVPALVFFSCKNIELRKLERSQKEIKHSDRKNIKAPQFHVIEIHKQTVRNVYEHGISSGKVIQHACMVRGHDKHYTEDKKLFGKISGAWFWESHARGGIGTPTVSDYRVHGPQHKGDCIVSGE